MKNWKNLKLILPMLGMLLSVHAAFGQSPQLRMSSASGLQKSGTGVGRRSAPSDRELAACAAAVEDLKATRVLAAALETENAALKKQLDTTKQSVDLLNELNETRKSEAETLRGTVAAKNEAIGAKDAVIASQEKLIEALKKKKSSPWKRLGDVLIGAAVIAILK